MKQSVRDWPANEEPASLESLASACKRALMQGITWERINADRDVEWAGPPAGRDGRSTALGFPDMLRADYLGAEREQGRDVIDVILAIAIRLGIEQGRRIVGKKGWRKPSAGVVPEAERDCMADETKVGEARAGFEPEVETLLSGVRRLTEQSRRELLARFPELAAPYEKLKGGGVMLDGSEDPLYDPELIARLDKAAQDDKKSRTVFSVALDWGRASVALQEADKAREVSPGKEYEEAARKAFGVEQAKLVALRAAVIECLRARGEKEGQGDG